MCARAMIRPIVAFGKAACRCGATSRVGARIDDARVAARGGVERPPDIGERSLRMVTRGKLARWRR
eukprot:6166615-Prymnesium_polylepis.1